MTCLKVNNNSSAILCFRDEDTRTSLEVYLLFICLCQGYGGVKSTARGIDNNCSRPYLCFNYITIACENFLYHLAK